MSALYKVTYQGVAGIGEAVLYIGNGLVLGAGVQNGRYQGTVQAVPQGMTGNIGLTIPPGTSMVTGPVSPTATHYDITLTWPSDWSTPGRVLPVTVVGMGLVSVTLDKIGDIPAGGPEGFNFSTATSSGGVLPH